MTGEASCPICGLEGICEGTAIHFEVVTSETECEVNTVVDGYIERGNTYKMSAHFLPSASAVRSSTADFFLLTFGGLGALKIQYNKKIILRNYWRSIFLSFGYMRSIAMVAGDWVKNECSWRIWAGDGDWVKNE